MIGVVILFGSGCVLWASRIGRMHLIRPVVACDGQSVGEGRNQQRRRDQQGQQHLHLHTCLYLHTCPPHAGHQLDQPLFRTTAPSSDSGNRVLIRIKRTDFL